MGNASSGQPESKQSTASDTAGAHSAKAATPRPERTPVVMVVGKSGMGKSTLCNLLLYGKSDPDGFKTAGGHNAVTTECEERMVQSTPPPSTMTGGAPAGGPLRVIDTPGIPDTNKCTIEFYDKIVETARRTGGLNALIITVIYGNDRTNTIQDFEKYATLLSQFDKMPCLKIILCRFEPSPFANSEEQFIKELEPVKDWVKEIMLKGKMESAKVIFLFNRNPTMFHQIFVLRQLVLEQPSVPVEIHNIRTHAEMKHSARRLVEPRGREEELEEIRRNLEARRIQLSTLNHDFEVKEDEGSEILEALLEEALGVGALVSGFRFFSSTRLIYRALKLNISGADIVRDNVRHQILSNEEEKAEIDRELVKIREEMAFGAAASPEVLQADKEALERLEKLE